MCDAGTCDAAVAKLRASLKVRKLLGAKQEMKITCRPCASDGPEGGARALLLGSSPLEIVLCTNRLSGAKEIEEVVVHELVHVFDHTNKRCDLSTCEGLAYTEVRAAREAECNRFFPMHWLKSECIRTHATRSTANLFPADAAKCVAASFDRAMQDGQPFFEDDGKPSP